MSESLSELHDARTNGSWTVKNTNSEGFSDEDVNLFTAGRLSGYLGVTNPSWRSQIVNGQDATTSFSGWKHTGFTSTPGNGTHTYQYTNANGVQSGSIRLSGETALSRHAGIETDNLNYFFSDPDLRSRLIVKFLASASAKLTQFQGGVFLGELRKTAQMIRNPASALRTGLSSYLDTLKSTRIRGASRRRRFAASTWLEYSFGWVPLMNDIKSGYDAMSSLLNGRPPLIRISASGESSTCATVQEQDRNYGYNFNFAVYHDDKVTQHHRVIGAVKVLPPGMPGTSTLFGVNPIRNFVPTAWELVPYSFLVDYFSNIGEILSSTTVIPSDIAWAAHQVRVKRDYRIYGYQKAPTIFGAPYFGESNTATMGESTSHMESYSRSTVPDLFDLRHRLPRFRIPGTSTKWINMAALASQHRRMLPYF
jgi:hypothetical protein